MARLRRMRLTGVLLAAVLAAGSTNAAGADRRLERLQTTIDLWGRVYFYHPAVVTTDIDWEAALVAAIPRVERARSTGEFVAALNRMLEPLDDPLTRAWVREERQEDEGGDTVSVITGRRLDEATGYVDMRHPAALAGPGIITGLAAACESLGEVERLVVDLRWPSGDVEPHGWSQFLRLFADTTLQGGSHFKRQHLGWSESGEPSAYRQWLELNNGQTVKPIGEPDAYFDYLFRDVDPRSLRPVDAAVVFLVNRASYPLLFGSLDAFQATRRHAVLFENSGRAAVPEWLATEFPEGVLAQYSSGYMLACNGGFDFQPDLEFDGVVPDGRLAELAGAALDARQDAVSACVPMPRMRFRPAPAVSLDPLSREERILGLAKTWVVMRDFFPHLDLAEGDWDSVPAEWLPRVEAAKTVGDYYLVLDELASRLNDSHVRIYHDLLDEVHVPLVRLGRVEGRVLVTGLNPDSSLDGLPVAVGDEVVSIAGLTPERFEARWRPRMSVSTPGAFYRNLYDYGTGLRGPEGSTIEVVVRHAGRAEPLALTRAIPYTAWLNEADAAAECRVLDGNIGYLAPGFLASAARLQEALATVAGTDGLVLDNRGTSGAFFHALIPHLCDRPALSALFETPTPGSEVEWSHRWASEQYEIEPEEPRYGKPMVVLVNERTQSSLEDVCIYLRNMDRVTFVGSRTAGTNGNVAFLSLPGGGRLRFTAMRVRFGDGSPFQNIGITPDHKVSPTVAGIREGRDEVLEKGVEVLQGLIAE